MSSLALCAAQPILLLVASDSPRDINRRMNELRLELYPELEREDLVAFMRRLLVAGG